uniref:Transthyretin-like family protein n=1 Tax=Caenorhabditis tropicalis TaxID=1561998 RepID=A0A1I7TZR3_9PELO
MKLSICLFSFLILGVVSYENKFRFAGTVLCRSEKPWCVRIRVIEVDTLIDDTIAADDFCSTEQTRTYDIEGVDENDGILDRNFEIQMVVTHNCSRNTETVFKTGIKRIPLPKAPTEHATIRQHLNLNMNNSQ